MKKFFLLRRDGINVILASLASVLVVMGAVYAASTISTNITSDGNLTAAGTVNFSGTSATTTISGGLVVDSPTFMVDFSSSRVGIGTTSPGTIFGVSGSAVFTGLLTFESFNATSTSATSTILGGLTVDTNTLLVDFSTNRVGIATSSPGTTLGVSGPAVFTGLLTFPNFNATSTTATSTILGGLTVDTSTLLADFSTNRVGIGTTSPGTTLGVQGDIVGAGILTASTLSATSTTATSTISAGITFATSAGNVGIGSTTPFHQLGIDGAGTTTVGIGTTAANRGACLQLQGVDGLSYRVYAQATTSLLWSRTSDGFLVVEAGPCW